MSQEGDGFLSRWSRRKARVREGVELPPEQPPTAPVPVLAEPEPVRAEPIEARQTLTNPATSSEPTQEPPPAPTLADVAQLTRGSDFRRFVAPDVEAPVRNAALKKLFTSDPQFNVMDGLDTYIDDYGKPDPIPASMLRKMVQAHALGLFDDDEEEEAKKKRQTVAAASGADPDGADAPLPPPSDPVPTRLEEDFSNDDHAAVRLQPDDAAGPSGPADGAGPDAGRER